MAISAADVKKLRDMTGAGMMDCKKALTEANGDLEAAIENLRKHGIAKAEKKADRASSEGIIVIAVTSDNKKAALLEFNCETDFVGKNQEFMNTANKLAETALNNDIKTAEELAAFEFDGKTGKDLVTEAVMKLGENIQIGQIGLAKCDGFISTYIHMNGKIGVAVKMVGDYTDKTDEVGKNIAMQIAAMNPVATRREGVSADLIAKETEIFKEQIRESGKPENLIDRIAEGKLNKYFSEICLLEQSYVKEQKKSVKDYLAEVSKELGTTIDVEDFVRINIGE